MLFADHVRRLASLCFYWLRQLRSIRRTLTTKTTTCTQLVISRIDYCNGYTGWRLRRSSASASSSPQRCMQQGWSSVNGNMTAYRYNPGHPALATNSSTGRVQDVYVFSCTTACTIYHPFVQRRVSQSLSIPAADAYDQLHAVTSSSHHKNSLLRPS